MKQVCLLVAVLISSQLYATDSCCGVVKVQPSAFIGSLAPNEIQLNSNFIGPLAPAEVRVPEITVPARQNDVNTVTNEQFDRIRNRIQEKNK
jgi:hypothetical protein